MASFRWLHLTDLHLGLGAQDHLWPNVREAFHADLGRLHETTGPWHAVLFTGDLVQRGSADEFTRLDGWLEDLWKHLEHLGSKPVLLAVPGNHDPARPDLTRPRALRAAARQLLKWGSNPEIHEELWSDPESEYRAVVAEAFAGFQGWWSRCPFRGALEIAEGLLPGDFAATWEGDGLRVGLAGLNTAFLQLAGGDFEGRLACDVRQLHEATRGDVAQWAAGHDLCLLLAHQPPSWLDPTSRTHLATEINPVGGRGARFGVLLCGHLHERVAHAEGWGGGGLRRLWQGGSLFGLERYGEEAKEERRHGYAVGLVHPTGQGYELRLFPRLGVRSANGWRLDRDVQRFELEEDGGTREHVAIDGSGPQPAGRRRRPAAASRPARKVAAEARREAAVASYAEAAWKACDIVDLVGLPEDDRHLAMKKFLLRQLYVPLRVVMEPPSDAEAAAGALLHLQEARERQRLRAAGRRAEGARPSLDPQPVAPRLAASRRLVVLGDPGGGKSTLLRWLATAYLMRRSGNSELVTLPDAETLPAEDWLPVLVRCRDLEAGHLKGVAVEGLVGQAMAHLELGEAGPRT